MLIKHVGATAAEVVKSARKVVSIVLSYLFLAKPFTTAHLIGGSLFVASVIWGARAKSAKDKDSKAKSSPAPGGGV